MRQPLLQRIPPPLLYVAALLLAVGLTLAYLGVATVLGSGWALPLLAVPLYVIHTHVIPMEERLLGDAFGETYARYKTHVRRWL